MTIGSPDDRDTSRRWADLAQGVRAGDQVSDEEFARAFYPHVMAMTAGRLRDRETASEITQEVLLGVLQALRKGQLRDPDKLPAFVIGTARNLINHHLQELATHPRITSFNPGVAADPPTDRHGSPQELEIEEKERRAIAREVLRKLKPMDRRILYLTLAEGLNPREIALEVGLKPENVRNRKSRALKAVKRRMARWIQNVRRSHS